MLMLTMFSRKILSTLLSESYSIVFDRDKIFYINKFKIVKFIPITVIC